MLAYALHHANMGRTWGMAKSRIKRVENANLIDDYRKSAMIKMAWFVSAAPQQRGHVW